VVEALERLVVTALALLLEQAALERHTPLLVLPCFMAVVVAVALTAVPQALGATVAAETVPIAALAEVVRQILAAVLAQAALLLAAPAVLVL